jgi:hypothetical protein
MAITTVTPIWVEDIETSYNSDDVCKQLIAQATAGTTLPVHYTFHSGILRYKGRISVGNDNLLKNKLLETFHSSPLGGHSGVRASYHRIKRIFHWPNMKKDLELFIQQCPTCQRSKSEHCHYPGLLVPLPIHDMAWCHISMDFVEGLPKSNGKEIILVVVDRLTKYPISFPLPTLTLLILRSLLSWTMFLSSMACLNPLLLIMTGSLPANFGSTCSSH